jgi:hypothetical protein
MGTAKYLIFSDFCSWPLFEDILNPRGLWAWGYFPAKDPTTRPKALGHSSA